jgi:hypothetical protein
MNIKRNKLIYGLLITVKIVLVILVWARARSLVASSLQGTAQQLDVFLPLVVKEGVEEVFRHPLLALAEMDGPRPLFEVLDDPQGRRYVIGEGSGVPQESGQLTTVSGLLVAQRRPMRPDEFDKPDPPLTLPPLPVVNPDLAELIATLPPDALVMVRVDVKNETARVQVELERAIADGRIRSQTEYDQTRDRLLDERQNRLTALLGPIVQTIQDVGGEVDFLCHNMPCLTASIPASSVTRLATEPGIIELDIVRAALPNAIEPTFQSPPTIITGVTVRQGAQIQQFLDNSYDGNGINESAENDNIVVAVAEAGGGYTDHDGFRENSPASSFRYATGGGSTGKWQCDSNGCNAVDSFASLSNHAMGAAGILFGDLEDGQIPAVSLAQRPTASGYATEARAHLVWFSGTSGAVEMFDHLAGLTSSQRIPDLVSNSWGYWESPHCSGQGGVSRAANRLYEDGVAVFAAAHNQGGSAANCQITAPGSAIGVFTVGAHLLGYEGDPNTVRTADIYEGENNQSSWGGNSNEGQSRSIVDITAPGTRANKFNSGGSFSQTGVICCTSLATPTVAGAAADFIDFYHDRYSSFIDNPGVLYATMLLMGDRQGVSGKISGSPDHRWGTGRLRMRMFNGTGMDAPWWYGRYWTCVSDGEVYELEVAGGDLLNDDFDAFKAAAYWYDRRHDGSSGSDAGQVADVDLALVDATSGEFLRGDYDAYDNKARIYYQDVGNRRVNVWLSGYDVEGHTDPVCGQDAIQVFFTFFAEYSDRESPTFNPITGTGIFPEGS